MARSATKATLTLMFGLLFCCVIVLGSPVGFEYLEGGSVLHVWNNATREPNYYYSSDCLNDLSNLPLWNNTQWEYVSKSLGVQVSNVSINFELPFSGCVRSDLSDNLTYVNNSAGKTICWGSKCLNFGIESYLGLEDETILQSYYFWTNAGVSLNQNIWFKLNSSNISVVDGLENDFLVVVNRSTNLTEYYNLSAFRDAGLMKSFNATSGYYPFYIVEDLSLQQSFLREWWNETKESRIVIDRGDVIVYFNLGKFSQNQIKYVRVRWVDAGCTCTGGGTISATSNYPNGTSFNVGESFEFQCKVSFSGFGSCTTGCSINYMHNQYVGTGELIHKTANATDIIDCDSTGTYCQIRNGKWNTYHNLTVNCDLPGVDGTFCIHENIVGWTELNSVLTNITCVALPAGGFVGYKLPPLVERRDYGGLVAGFILLPLLFSFVLVGVAFVIDKDRHAVLRVGLWFLSLILFLVSLNFGLVSLVEFYDFPVLEDLIGSTVYWFSLVLVAVVFYWIFYLVYTSFMMFKKRRSDRELAEWMEGGV